MSLKAVGNHVIVKPDEAEEKTESGLFIPQTAQEAPTFGTVLSASEDVEKLHDVHAGDRVLWNGRYAGATVIVEGEEYLVLDIGEVLGVVS